MANKFITGNSFSTGDQVTSTKLNESINLATFDSGAVDDSTTAISSGAIIVKDGGVSPSKISTGGPSWDSSGNVSVSGNIDVDGTTNLDAVDIDGNVQVDGTVTVGVNDTGHDVKFFGDTSGAYIQFDASADKLLTAGGATVDVVKDKLLIGGTAVTTTAAELNVLDGVTAGTITASKGVVVDSNKDIASLRNITLTGELDAGSLDVSGNADIDGTLETDALSINGTAVTSTAAEINLLDGSTANTVVNSKAVVYGSGGQVAVTSLSGTLADGVTGTTQSSGDNSTKVATTAYVDAQVGTSDTLAEVLANGNTTGSNNIVVDNGQSITTNTISETTSASGVTIDGVLIKDNAITASGEIDGGSLDISGDADIDGTLEADAITVNGTALDTVIAGTTVTNATNSAHVLVTDNESTNEENLITFVEGATSSTGNVGLEMDGNLSYNPSTGTVSSTVFKGNIDAVDGDFDGTLEADAITIGGTAIGSLFSPLAGGSDIVTTGALNSGSITSGFGSIDNGSSAITTTGVGSFGSLDISGNIDVDGTTNLDVVDIDGAVDMASNLTIDGELTVKGGGSGSIVVNDEDSSLCPTMTFLRNGGGTTTNDFIKFENSGGEVATINSAGGASFSGNLDVDGTTNLDVVDIDGAVQIDSTLTVGVDDTGHDVKFFGATSGSYMQWDESLNRLIVNADGVGLKLDGSSSTTKSIFFRQTNSSNPAQVYADGSLRLFTEDNGTDIRFHVNSDGSSNEKMRINATGVGIGTAAPDELLHVKGGSDRPLVVESTDAFCFISLNDNSTSAQSAVMIGAQGDDLRIDAGDSERIRVESNGNIGIGTSSPGSKLEVNGTTTISGDTVLNSDLEINVTGASNSSKAIVINSSGTNFESDDGMIRIVHPSTGSGALTGGFFMKFNANSADKFTVKGNGDTAIAGSLFVGGTALAQSDSFGVDSNGIIYSARSSGSASHAIFYNGSSVVGSITTSTSATAFNTSSDYRLKENETNIIDGIDRLKQLSPYRFNFKVDPDETVDGFFAHEVSDIVPEAITGTKDGMKEEEYEVSPAVYEDVVHPAVEATYDEDGNELTPAVEEWTESVLVTEAVMDTRSVPDYQGIDQSKLVPLLTAALQEAVAKIEALEARVQTLEG